jgi:hypothetical protein
MLLPLLSLLLPLLPAADAADVATGLSLPQWPASGCLCAPSGCRPSCASPPTPPSAFFWNSSISAWSFSPGLIADLGLAARHAAVLVMPSSRCLQHYVACEMRVLHSSANKLEQNGTHVASSAVVMAPHAVDNPSLCTGYASQQAVQLKPLQNHLTSRYSAGCLPHQPLNSNSDTDSISHSSCALASAPHCRSCRYSDSYQA